MSLEAESSDHFVLLHFEMFIWRVFILLSLFLIYYLNIRE